MDSRSMNKPLIEKNTVADQVCVELRRRIVAGEYESGMRLRQEEIAAELGISRSPVREALRQLEAEGLVTLTSQKGAKVAPILAEEITELFELRLLIEPHLLALAIPASTESDFEAAEKTISEMKNADMSQWSKLNWQLHLQLYQPAQRPTTLGKLERIHQTIDRYLRVQVTLTDGREKAHEEHQAILQACRDRDTELATAMLRSHILAAARSSRGAS
ncbi:GntR family transcriptional regulator [Nitratireductor sp. StC3]|nr:GntR family transcriptional regulator [Nitratireductor sp. StC3]